MGMLPDDPPIVTVLNVAQAALPACCPVDKVENSADRPALRLEVEVC